VSDKSPIPLTPPRSTEQAEKRSYTKPKNLHSTEHLPTGQS